eukprot:333880_1
MLDCTRYPIGPSPRIDYNNVNIGDNTIRPDINQLLSRFRGKNVITSLDMKGGYWHIPIYEPHKERTAFVFDGNIYEWNFMPFGPSNAPAYFQQVMNELFGHLGFIVDKYGIRPTEKYKQKIFNVPRPTTKPALQRFIGLVQYLQRFIPHLSNHIKPLTALLRGGQHRIVFQDEHIAAFNKIKQLVQNTTYLLHPDITKPFYVFCDASKNGLGAALCQYDDTNTLRPVQFCSKT